MFKSFKSSGKNPGMTQPRCGFITRVASSPLIEWDSYLCSIDSVLTGKLNINDNHPHHVPFVQEIFLQHVLFSGTFRTVLYFEGLCDPAGNRKVISRVTPRFHLLLAGWSQVRMLPSSDVLGLGRAKVYVLSAWIILLPQIKRRDFFLWDWFTLNQNPWIDQKCKESTQIHGHNIRTAQRDL